jgi:hypothetical protein
MYLRPLMGFPAADDKLVVGVEEKERDEVLIHWDPGSFGADVPSLDHKRWMLESDYDELVSRVRLLADDDVKNDEDLNMDDVKQMRGETPMPRNPWGFARTGAAAAAGGGGGGGRLSSTKLQTRVRVFDPSKPLGLHLNLKTMEVTQVDTTGQGGSVLRVGWRLTSIDDAVCRSAHDVRACLQRLEHSGATHSSWVFTVPLHSAANTALNEGPPFAVISGQRVRRERADGTLERNAQIAFRFAPNGCRYRDAFSGEEVLSATKYFPEGREKALLATEGDFPQNGQRIPLFGEAPEVCRGENKETYD